MPTAPRFAHYYFEAADIGGYRVREDTGVSSSIVAFFHTEADCRDWLARITEARRNGG